MRKEEIGAVSSYEKVSVIICTYNGAAYVAATLDSVLSQTYDNIEIVVLDDGSEDQTVTIVKEYCLQDSRIKLYTQTNKGLPAARNNAVGKAVGEWVAIIDQDDLCYPARVERQLAVAKKFPSAKLIFSDTDHIDEDGRVIGSNLSAFVLPKLIIRQGLAGELLLRLGCYIDSESCFFKRSLVVDIGGFDESLKYACDYDFFIRAGFATDFAYSTERLSAWRIHPKQQSSINIDRYSEYRRVLLNYIKLQPVSTKLKLVLFVNCLRSYVGEQLYNVKSTIKSH